jgi:pectate lyase
MEKTSAAALCLLLAVVGAGPAAAAVPAFPGAEGWGKNAMGGGQNPKTQVLFVTSLEDSGPGTLREALMQSGPRIIIFRTGGIIDLKSRISFAQDHATIAGQTAPGDGIIIRNFPIRIGANHVIMRGLRIRNGDGPGPPGDLRDSIEISRATGDPIHDVIVDHCSFGWSVDETVEFWYGARNVTLSYCVFGEALWKSIHQKGSHGYAMLFGNGPSTLITLHHNLFAHNDRRNPWIKDNAKIEMINNVVYNWGTEATGLWGAAGLPPVFANVIGNYYKAGADTSRNGRGIGMGKPPSAGSKFYIRDNTGPGRTADSQDDWDAVKVGAFDAAEFRAKEPIAELVSGLKAEKPADARERTLAHAGAVPRDKADSRAVEDSRKGTGRHVDKMADIGGYPAYAAGSYPPDADGDGIPDEWERAHGLDPNDKADAVRFSAGTSGYLNIEVYINSLIPDETKPAK